LSFRAQQRVQGHGAGSQEVDGPGQFGVGGNRYLSTIFCITIFRSTRPIKAAKNVA
jgi:hypothetical protein